jgi:hypothetical protein
LPLAEGSGERALSHYGLALVMGNLILIKDAAHRPLAFSMRGIFPAKGLRMRAPSKRDQCQAMLDILVEGFMSDDVPAYREACAWLRDFADQKNIEQGRVMCGSNWYAPREFEALRERCRIHALEGWKRRLKNASPGRVRSRNDMRA